MFSYKFQFLSLLVPHKFSKVGDGHIYVHVYLYICIHTVYIVLNILYINMKLNIKYIYIMYMSYIYIN